MKNDKKIIKDVWDFSPIFSDDKDPKIQKKRSVDQKAGEKFINKWKDRADYLNDPTVLVEALDEYEAWAREHGPFNQEIYYFQLRTQQDLLDTNLKASANQALELGRKMQNEMQFFPLRIAKIPSETQKALLKHDDLQKYKHYLERLFEQARHQLSESEEKIMNLKEDSSHENWVHMVSAFISKEERKVLTEDGKRVTKSFSDLLSLTLSKNKKVRDGAAEAINDVLEKHFMLAEQELNSILGNKKVDDELRQFPRPDSERHLSDDIETEIVDVLVEKVSSRFDIPRRWYELKAKLLGVKKLEYHERMVEYGGLNKKYSYDDSCQLVSSVFHNLDKDFGEIFDRFVKNNQIDVYPKKGKTGGAFCAAGSLTLPTYILLNHTETFNDVSTLAHEAGHGINDELMKANLNSLNFGSPLSTAEVASTFMEDFVTAKVISEADEEMKLAIMVKKLDDDVATIFRQIACYLFEKELHEQFRKKGYLSRAEIGQVFQKNMSAYMGDAIEMSKGSENWWVYWGHIRNFFYVYSYASGLLISKSLQNSVKKDPNFISKVKQFLSSGMSDSPKEIFAKMSVNISDGKFWESGIQEIENLLAETEVLAKKLGKI